MNQTEARRRAKELGGIAIGARPGGKGWNIGGWSGQQKTWIVVSLDMKRVLDDHWSEGDNA